MSYDDGKHEDRRLVELFNKHGIKGTFNLNGGLEGDPEVAFHLKKSSGMSKFSLLPTTLPYRMPSCGSIGRAIIVQPAVYLFLWDDSRNYS